MVRRSDLEMRRNAEIGLFTPPSSLAAMGVAQQGRAHVQTQQRQTEAALEMGPRKMDADPKNGQDEQHGGKKGLKEMRRGQQAGRRDAGV